MLVGWLAGWLAALRDVNLQPSVWFYCGSGPSPKMRTSSPTFCDSSIVSLVHYVWSRWWRWKCRAGARHVYYMWRSESI
jgi:hypothetical protein